ncbi:MAG: hypothetical protein ACRD2C_00080 [Acidimicrobiales bacterium]
MPVPLPTDDEVLLTPPSADEARATARAVAALVAPDTGLTGFQRILLQALWKAMTGHDVDLNGLDPPSPEQLAAVLARRNAAFRTRGLQVMLLGGLVLRPLPREVAERIAAAERELSVEEGMVAVAQRFAEGALSLAAADFDRNGYTSDWDTADTDALHTSVDLTKAWDVAVADPALAARWDALADLPDGTLGRRVWELYQARGFEVPGRPGSAPPLLAQHDWVHVLADYGTVVDSELEVFAFIARANDDMRAFSLLAMVVSLFETGYLSSGAGLFESSPGHLSVGEEMAVRVADAMYRGARCRDTVTGSDSVDFLRVDWFALAPLPLADVRARFAVEPKSHAAIAAGSVDPWEPGGISEFQLASGRAAAERDGRPYEA